MLSSVPLTSASKPWPSGRAALCTTVAQGCSGSLGVNRSCPAVKATGLWTVASEIARGKGASRATNNLSPLPGLAALAPVMGSYALSGVAVLLGAGLVSLLAVRRWVPAGLAAALVLDDPGEGALLDVEPEGLLGVVEGAARGRRPRLEVGVGGADHEVSVAEGIGLGRGPGVVALGLWGAGGALPAGEEDQARRREKGDETGAGGSLRPPHGRRSPVSPVRFRASCSSRRARSMSC